MEKEFFKKLEEIFNMESDTIRNSTMLPEDMWDSLTILSVAAVIDSVYDKVIPVKNLGKCNNIQDILDLIKEVK